MKLQFLRLLSVLTLISVLTPVAVVHGEMISWYHSNPDITNLSADVVAAPNTWTTADQAWNTSDEVIPAVGAQAALKAALSNVSDTVQNALVSVSANAIIVHGGGQSSAPSPYYTVAAFDVRSVDRSYVLNRIHIRKAKDTNDVSHWRWFVDAGGQTYVSEDLGEFFGYVDVDLFNDEQLEWFVFDGDVNLADAIGASVGIHSLYEMNFGQVDYVGVYTCLLYTSPSPRD